MPVTVDIDNYATAEVASQVDRFVALGVVVNQWLHFRRPTPLDQQTVIRMNRDTLYSVAVVDISAGATLTVPDGGGRYLTVMAINEDGYLNRVFHEAGDHRLGVDEFDTGFVVLVARTLADPTDDGDLAAANRLQDGLAVAAGSARAWESGRFDGASYQAVKKALLALGAAGVHDSARTFGRRDEVDRVRFLVGSAGGFGGLPESEAFYAIRAEPRPVGRYRLTVGEVPVDAFWSVSVYNRDGYFDPNEYDSYSVNSLTAARADDGTVTVEFGPEPGGDNFLYVTEGWNYVVRLYRPRPEVLDGGWVFPEPAPVG